MARFREVAAAGHPQAETGRRMVLVALCLGVLMAQIDTSVVNLATREIGAHLRAPLSTLQWVLDAYNLVYAALLLTGGALGDLLGRRRIFAAGIVTFSAGCLACTLAPGPGVLVAGRAVAGLGAALLLPCSLAIVRVVWPDPAERGHALGIWASCNGLAFAIGPTIGGVLIAHFGWRSVFAVVLPFGAATLALARRIPESADPAGRHLDLKGQVLGALGLGALALAAIESHRGQSLAIGAAVVAVVGLLLFLAVERRAGEGALVPLSLFRQRGFSGAVAATASMTFGMYGLLFLVPLAWQSSGGLSPLQAGLGLLPMALAFAIISPRSGWLTERLGARWTTAGGTALIGCGLLITATTAGGAPMLLAQVGMVLAGIGMGTNTGPLMAVAVASVASARSGTASALINVARMVGATLGVAVLGTVAAAAGGPAAGLWTAMLAGGLVQLAGAATAFACIR
jgi:EmrB/QacA subfamily drug resistance transporter